MPSILPPSSHRSFLGGGGARLKLGPYLQLKMTTPTMGSDLLYFFHCLSWVSALSSIALLLYAGDASDFLTSSLPSPSWPLW